MVNHESRMLIDGKLVDSETGRRFDNINPATEEVLGATSDGSRADMERAIAAARHAFDNSECSRAKGTR
jgi:aldehyde dehydrogenase (NAD+)